MSDRKNYVVHYMTLQVYLSLGMKLKKVHRVLTFKQMKFLKPYIDFCTSKRAAASSEFKKKMWKLCVNSCFGKFIESVRKYQDCSIVTSLKRHQKFIINPLYEKSLIISENCMIMMSSKPTLEMYKPIAVGFAILDRSKDIMYNAFYNQIRPIFPKCKVIFSDTDSFCLKIKTTHPDTVKQRLKPLMDFSNYHDSHPLHDSSRKNQLFYFKDELKGDDMTQFVGLRAKCYAFQTKTTEELKLKGITKAYRSQVNFESYLTCLREHAEISISQYQLRSRDHIITLDKSTRLALTSYDVNRFLFPCGIHTCPYGSKLTLRKKCPFCKNNPRL
jgi:hypothetical protein